MSKRVLIFGSGGMLGSELTKLLSRDKRYKVFGCERKCADIGNLAAVAKVVRRSKPDFVINCAAKIDVVECEDRDPLGAWLVNAIGPGNIVRALGQAGLKKTVFIQVSTSDVFGGLIQKFYKETDLPYPVNNYGWSKLGGEKIVEREAKIAGIKYFIVRTSWIYSAKKDTFVDIAAKSIIDGRELKAVMDQHNVPIWVGDVVKVVLDLLKGSAKREGGIYHIAPRVKKLSSRYDLACFIAKVLGRDRRLIKKVPSQGFYHIPRPWSATLASSKFGAGGDWQKALRRYLISKYPVGIKVRS